MELINIVIIVLILVLIVLALINILLLSRNSSEKHNLELRNGISHDLVNFQQHINKEFDSLSDRTQDKLLHMEEQLNKNMIDSYKQNSEIFRNISERIIKIDEAQKGLNLLSSEVTSLQSILTDKKNRGTFGEIELYSLLEAAYGVNSEFFQKQYHLPNGSIADAVIFGGNSLGILCIDSKFPLENYRRMIDNDLSDIEKDNAKKAFKNDVKKHIDDIKNKYIIEGATADMAYMFIPAEAIYSEIVGFFPDLMEKSYKDKVYLVSPTTLMAYITAIKSIYLGQKKDEKAKEIQKLLAELSIEFNRFITRNETLNKDFLKLSDDFDSLKTTSDKIAKRFKKINEGDIDA